MNQGRTAEDFETPFSRIGGVAMVQAVVERFYDLMDREPEFADLRAVHAPDLAPMREALSDFLTAWLGGPPLWAEKHPGVCIMSRHRKLNLSEAVETQWLAAMRRALDDCGAEPVTADLMMQAFARMARNMRPSQDTE